MLSKQYLRSVELKNPDTTKSKEIYPFGLPVVQHLNQINFHPKVTFLVGENGTGKSTLLEAIAIAFGFNPEGGSKNFMFSTHNSHSELSEEILLVKGATRPKDGYFLRAESFYNVASNIDQIQKEWGGMLSSYGGVSLHEKSHGEAFFTLFMERFSGKGLYFLDEPEAALSPQTQLSLLVRLDELINDKSQFIIATHSPIIMAYPNSQIIQISKNGIEKVKYEETIHYELYKTFMDDPMGMIKRLNLDN
jgi:predicted ATPase